MELAVLNQEGKDTGRKVTLADDLFAVEPNDHAVYLDVRQYQANQRQGTHKAKERGEIARTTKKFFRQKGTGNARMGSLRSPIHRGGGTVFGPRPRNYSFKLNKKLKGLARKSVLSQKVAENNLGVVEKFNFDKPSTKTFVNILHNLNLGTKKSLIVLGEEDKTVYLSSRNFRGTKVVTVSKLNTYDLTNAHKVILTEDSLEKLETVLRK